LLINTTGSCSRNTTNTSNSNIHYHRYGGVIVLTGWFILTTNGCTTGKEILTGIPAPKININVFAYDQTDGKIYYYEITGKTTVMKGLQNISTSSAGHYLNIQVAYILDN
jgi:hypothetical protein